MPRQASYLENLPHFIAEVFNHLEGTFGNPLRGRSLRLPIGTAALRAARARGPKRPNPPAGIGGERLH